MKDAELITAADAPGAFTLHTLIDLDHGQVREATLRCTAHGVFEVRIDGQQAGGVLAPGWSAYERRLPVERYDVTELIRDGAELQVLVGNGWWRGKLGFEGLALDYGDRTGFIGELDIVYTDGRTRRIATDTTWTARTAAVSDNSLYDGVRIDASARPRPLRVETLPIDRDVLVPQVKPPIERQETLSPQRIWTSPSGGTLVDFGQNLVGWTRLRVTGPPGSTVTVRHAEVLEAGEPATRPLRGARATDTYILSGADDVFEPTLTFHGFRYAEFRGLPGELHPEDVEAVVVHSRMRRTGTFECSDPRVNRLVENSVWGQRGNFLDVPTDCPQRDERLGWTGDIAVYAAAACYQFDCADVLHGWLADLHEETKASGHVPFVVPNVLKLVPREALGENAAIVGPTAVWGDAAVWVPEALWWAFGDAERLAEHYPAMVLHLESILPRLSETGLWDTGFQFGDWLDPTAPPDAPLTAKADRSVIATASLYRSAVFAADTAAQLGLRTDERRWRALADRTRAAFQAHYVSPDGLITSDAQAVYALAIHFGLLDDAHRQRAGDRLARLVAQGGHRVQTGFAGTPFVVWALTATGHTDTAYRLLLQDEPPSWLYMVAMGATTIWERWDSLLPDGTVNPGEMTSFNHYALGAVVDWLYKCVAGIRPALPGYARLHLEPVPGPGLDWARGRLDTRHGRVECGWTRHGDGTVTVECLVPDGVEADLHLPDGSTRLLTSGPHSVRLEGETAT
ncbi:alpha-L-rhamnosidase [Nocardiopsis sp. CNS-639]|uniref:alpha-L-rhamnosidase n=1 Tax=Nocardiopsis sp. CNS-639 TaxID=1169153 RepID=UPI00036C5C70|nr:alpha-L-rhamnosidase [Nocardiopsis sp. CNS-639]